MFYAVMFLYVPRESNEIFFLPSSLHREVNKKDDLSFRCFLKLSMETVFNVNIWRQDCLLGTENMCAGLGKRHVLVGDSYTFELVLVTYTLWWESSKETGFSSVRFFESLCSQPCCPKTVVCALSLA